MNKSIYYSNGTDIVKEHDIVRIKVGAFKGDLAIIVNVDRETKYITIKNIKNSMQFTFNVRSVEFCYHNTKAAAKAWYKQMEDCTAIYYNKYKSVKYIINNWFNDAILFNNITSVTLQKALDFKLICKKTNDALDWLDYWRDAFDVCIIYKDKAFCIDYLNKQSPGKYSDYIIDKICNLIKEYDNGDS